MKNKIEGEYVSPNVKVICTYPGHAILAGSIDSANESYDEENI